MKLRILRPCECGDDKCEGFDYLIFRSKHFQIRWFIDYGTVFLYIHLGKKYWSFDW